MLMESIFAYEIRRVNGMEIYNRIEKIGSSNGKECYENNLLLNFFNRFRIW